MKHTIRLLEAIRSIAIIAIVAVIGFSMAACKEDDGSGGGDVKFNVPVELVGKWHNSQENADAETGFFIEIKSDGTAGMSGMFGGEVSSYNWGFNVNGNKLESYWGYTETIDGNSTFKYSAQTILEFEITGTKLKTGNVVGAEKSYIIAQNSEYFKKSN